MKCPLCGLRFKEEESAIACQGCPISRPCGLIKCPNCGYEIPRDTGLIKFLNKLREKKHATKR